MFKLDTINKVSRCVAQIYSDSPELYTFSEDLEGTLGFFKFLVPLLHKNLNDEDLTVLIELMCFDLAGTYNDLYYKIKNVYDAIILFKTDPELVFAKYQGVFNEIKGFDRFKA
jgi:hypothetical protein